MTEASILIKGQNLKKAYEQLEVLKGIDIVVRKGEMLAIVGKSGAGKSTLLHIMGTLDTLDQGELLIAGKDITSLSSKAIAQFRNQNIGFVFQFHYLLPEFTALENVMIPGALGGHADSLKDRATALLGRLGMDHRLEHKPSELSGGEQQRVAVARALINSPKIVLADEPTGNLDSLNSDLLFDLFVELKNELSQTLVIVTHSELLAKRCDRILRMEDGRVIDQEILC